MLATPEKPETVSIEDHAPRQRIRFARSIGVSAWIGPVFAVAAGSAEAYLIWSSNQISLLESALIHGGLVLVLGYLAARSLKKNGHARAIVSSLAAFLSGQRSVDALRVAEDFGPIAQTYNRILEERDEIARQELVSQLEHTENSSEHGSDDLQTAIDGMWHGLALFDAGGKARVLNGAIRIQLGIERDPALGTPYDRLFSDAEIIEAIDMVINRKQRQRQTFEICRGEESEVQTILRISVKPTVDGGAIVIVEDTTQQHAADRARANVIAHTTHELRTPLSNIRLYVEEALDAPEDDQKLRSHSLNIINQETRRLERMVSDMLSASEIESGSLQLHIGDVRLDALFQELTEDYQAAAEEKGLSFGFELPPKLPVIQGDRQKLAVALHNLIGNAIKYTPAGGAVSVHVCEESAMLRVEVADTGIGIPETETERIFDRFYRSTDPRVGEITGTGLGLTLAREIAVLHGGTITLESEPDSGSRFTLSIPLPEQRAAAA